MNSDTGKKVPKPLSPTALKVVLIGDEKTGKSAIAQRFEDNKFLAEYSATIGVQFWRKNLSNPNVKVDIWDTAGQERFLKLTQGYCKDSKAIGIVIDITFSAEEQAKSMRTWIDRAKTYEPNAKLYFIGNKLDSDTESGVTVNQEAFVAAAETVNAEQKKASGNDAYEDIPHLLCSAKTGDGIEAIFSRIATDCISSPKPEIIVDESKDSLDPNLFQDQTPPWERFKETVVNHPAWFGGNVVLIGLTAIALIALALFPPTAVLLFGVPLSGLALAGMVGGAAVLLWNAVCGIKNLLGGGGEEDSKITDNPNEKRGSLAVSSSEAGKSETQNLNLNHKLAQIPQNNVQTSGKEPNRQGARPGGPGGSSNE